jgi:hypothetical protein
MSVTADAIAPQTADQTANDGKIRVFRWFVLSFLALYSIPYLTAIVAALGYADPTDRGAIFVRSFLGGERSFLTEVDTLLLPLITFVSAYSFTSTRNERWTVVFLLLGLSLIAISIVGEVLYNSDDTLRSLGMSVGQKNGYLQNFVALRSKMMIYVSLMLGISQSRSPGRQS